jgi:hypothetical protein
VKVRSEVDLMQVAKTLGNAVTYNQAKFLNLFFVHQASSSHCLDEQQIRWRGLADQLNPTARQGVLDLAEHVRVRTNLQPAPPAEAVPAEAPPPPKPKPKPRKKDSTPVTITLPARMVRRLLGGLP